MPEAGPRWPRSLLITFRFAVCFYAFTTLYLAVGHLSMLLPFLGPLAETTQYGGLFAAYNWLTEQLFGPVVYSTDAGFFAYLSTALLVAGAATLVWSLLDRHRRDYRRAHVWLRLYLRYLLAAVALSYGLVKVIPSQFAPPSLVALLTPLGELTPMRLLWNSMGTSMAYTIFTGIVEVAGGLLLLWRRTTPLGALLLAAAFANVSVLNFGYQVGVQLNSTIYLLMALTLLAPDAKRLATALLERSRLPDAGTRRLERALKVAFIVLLVAMNLRNAYRSRQSVSARPGLYGIYDVVEFSRDGVPVPQGSEERWLRFVVAERGSGAIQWTAGGRMEQYSVKEDSAKGVLTFTGRGKDAPVLTFRYQRAGQDLELGGLVEGKQVAARLRAMDLTSFSLRRPRR